MATTVPGGLVGAERPGAPSFEDLTNTVNLVGVGISHLSLGMQVLWANPFYCRFLGYTLPELQAINIKDTTFPEDVPTQVEMIRRLRDGEAKVVTFEKRFLRRDGTVAWGRLTASLVRDARGQPRHYVAITADIGTLKEAEHELLLNRRQLEDAEAVALMGSYERDLVWGRLNWSPGGYRLFGLDPSGTELTFELFLSMVHPEDRPRLVDTLQRAFRDSSDYEMEYRILRLDGATRTLHVRGRLFKAPDGRPLRSLGTMQDVTALRDQERTIREQQQALAHGEALAAIGSLAASVAHEVNNPLAYVLLNLESVLAATETSPPAVVGPDRARLQEALDGVKRIGVIVKTLKGLSGAQPVEQGTVDPRKPVLAALSMAATGIQHRATLVKELGQVPHVHGDDVRLAQVFLNLLVNATGAIETGGVADNEIRVVVRHEGTEVVVEIRDTGCGIPPEHLGRIFEPFFSTKSRAKGTGLGLPISRKLVQEMGGRIEVSSTPGRGSCFSVHLRAAAPAPAATLAPGAGPQSLGLRVLVADDERLIRRAIARALPDCAVVEVGSGEEARQRLEVDRAFDLILCDMMMPQLSGMELRAWLEGFDRALASRMVFITGGAVTAEAQAFLERPDVRRLDKPFDGAALRAALQEAAAAAAPPG
jgi:PAS domain S-box-containing protein